MNFFFFDFVCCMRKKGSFVDGENCMSVSGKGVMMNNLCLVNLLLQLILSNEKTWRLFDLSHTIEQ
jgi:hypothetical protein